MMVWRVQGKCWRRKSLGTFFAEGPLGARSRETLQESSLDTPARAQIVKIYTAADLQGYASAAELQNSMTRGIDESFYLIWIRVDLSRFTLIYMIWT